MLTRRAQTITCCPACRPNLSLCSRVVAETLPLTFSQVMFLDDFVDTVLPGMPVNAFGAMDQLVSSCAARFVGAFAARDPCCHARHQTPSTVG